MRLLHHHQTLLFYETAEIFEALDAIGGHYLCLLTGADQSGDEYIAVGASPQRLRSLKVGEMDLRTLILNRELKEWYTLKVGSDITQNLEAVERDGDIPEKM